MIDLYFAPTPNGLKISIMLEECGLPYTLHPVRLHRGEQFMPEFLAINPNSRIPAIVDHDPPGGGAPLTVFESGAILLHLAERTGQFLARDPRQRSLTLQWLFWQVADLGPTLGQHGHFKLYASEQLAYASERYAREAHRLYRLLDGQLGRTGACIAGDYSIADIACFPWIRTHRAQGIAMDDYPHVKRWYELVRARPTLRAGIEVGRGSDATIVLDAEARRHLFGQGIA